jgi:hypothetical protein
VAFADLKGWNLEMEILREWWIGHLRKITTYQQLLFCLWNQAFWGGRGDACVVSDQDRLLLGASSFSLISDSIFAGNVLERSQISTSFLILA